MRGMALGEGGQWVMAGWDCILQFHCTFSLEIVKVSMPVKAGKCCVVMSPHIPALSNSLEQLIHCLCVARTFFCLNQWTDVHSCHPRWYARGDENFFFCRYFFIIKHSVPRDGPGTSLEIFHLLTSEESKFPTVSATGRATLSTCPLADPCLPSAGCWRQVQLHWRTWSCQWDSGSCMGLCVRTSCFANATVMPCRKAVAESPW